MKKSIALLTVLSSVFFSVSAIAQNKPIACLSDASAGFFWENRRWVLRSLEDRKFILIRTSDGLSRQSVAKVLNSPLGEITCRHVGGMRVSCTDRGAGFLIFDPGTLKGGVSQIFGAVQADHNTEKSTATVTTFSCTPF